jgi:hypothetical protein
MVRLLGYALARHRFLFGLVFVAVQSARVARRSEGGLCGAGG